MREIELPNETKLRGHLLGTYFIQVIIGLTVKRWISPTTSIHYYYYF